MMRVRVYGGHPVGLYRFDSPLLELDQFLYVYVRQGTRYLLSPYVYYSTCLPLSSVLSLTHTHSILRRSAELLREELQIGSTSRMQASLRGGPNKEAGWDHVPAQVRQQLIRWEIINPNARILHMYRIEPHFLDYVATKLAASPQSPYFDSRVRTLDALRQGLVVAPLPPRLTDEEGQMDPEEVVTTCFEDFDLDPSPPYYRHWDKELTEDLTLRELQLAGQQHLEPGDHDSLVRFYQSKEVNLDRVVQLNALLAQCGALDHHPQGYSSYESLRSHLLVPLWQFLGTCGWS